MSRGLYKPYNMSLNITSEDPCDFIKFSKCNDLGFLF